MINNCDGRTPSSKIELYPSGVLVRGLRQRLAWLPTYEYYPVPWVSISEAWTLLSCPMAWVVKVGFLAKGKALKMRCAPALSIFDDMVFGNPKTFSYTLIGMRLVGCGLQSGAKWQVHIGSALSALCPESGAKS